MEQRCYHFQLANTFRAQVGLKNDLHLYRRALDSKTVDLHLTYGVFEAEVISGQMDEVEVHQVTHSLYPKIRMGT